MNKVFLIALLSQSVNSVIFVEEGQRKQKTDGCGQVALPGPATTELDLDILGGKFQSLLINC